MKPFTKDEAWGSIDKLAELTGLSLPRLALGANMDQSTFAKSRRKCWPSLRTICRLLDAYGLDLEDWADIVEWQRG